MKLITKRKKSKSGFYSNRLKTTMNPLKSYTKALFGIDDFLSQILSMKERGDFVISGRRIC
jgi:hypothetical protein